MAIRRTHEQYLEELSQKNEQYKNGEFEVLGEYVNSASRILVKDKYGESFVTARSLLRYKTISIESAVDKTSYCINKFKEIHGDTYGYDKVAYVKIDQKVEIYCKVHQEYFWQTPVTHLIGRGCVKCGLKRMADIRRSDITLLKARFKEVHGDKYGYDKVNYVNIKTKVKVYCNTHKEYFWQIPSAHLQGQGCPKCTSLKRSEAGTCTLAYFITKAKNVHGDKYGYEEVEYIKGTEEVSIYCHKHECHFQQLPKSHLEGKGCRKCAYDKIAEISGENATGWGHTGWAKKAKTSNNFDSFKVYIIKCWNENEEFYKIGRTFNTVRMRFGTNNVHLMPYNYKVLKIFEGEPKEICELEDSFKEDNKEHKYLPVEEFRGKFECFSKLNEETLGSKSLQHSQTN